MQVSTLPEKKTIQIGNFKIGLIHGHQVVPWGDLESLAAIQRELDCDILISGHTLKNQISSHNGKYFINPGTATGCNSKTASFILMAVQGDNVTAFIYETKGEDFNVSRIDFSKNDDSQLIDASILTQTEPKEAEESKIDLHDEQKRIYKRIFNKS